MVVNFQTHIFSKNHFSKTLSFYSFILYLKVSESIENKSFEITFSLPLDLGATDNFSELNYRQMLHRSDLSTILWNPLS